MHPGYVSPGILVVFTTRTDTRSHDVVLAALAEADSEPPSNPVDLPLLIEAERNLDDYVEVCESVVQSARPAQLPNAWLHAARGQSNADYISIFDGGNANINACAATLGLVGLPPIDLNGGFPLNM